MSEAQAQRAIQNMYADPSVREELIDEEADVLLKWGEEQIANLAAQNWDDARFESASGNLNRLLNEINRFIGKRAYWSPAEQTASMGEIAKLAESLHYKVNPAALEAFPQQSAALSNTEAIPALTALFKSSTEAPSKPSLGRLMQAAAAGVTGTEIPSTNLEPTSSTEGEPSHGEEIT